MKVKVINTEEECKVCDAFLASLNSYEIQFDNVLNSDFKYEDVHKRNLGKDYTYIALAVEDVPVGYIFAYLKSSKGRVFLTNVVQIEALFVNEDYRNKGVGKLLVESVDNWAKDKFKDYIIELHAINSNVKAMEFYKRLGFSEVRTVFRR